MKRLRALLRRRKKNENGLEYVKSLVEKMLGGEGLYRDEVLFRDTLDELYSQLKELALRKGNENMVKAYEKAVILRYISDRGGASEKQLLEEILRLLGGR